MTPSTTAPPRPAPRPEVDPRIRARRIEVRRDEGRRRRQRLIVVAAVLAVVAGLAGLSRSPAMDVDHIVVSGADHTSATTVARASGIVRGQAMTDVDSHHARTRIAALPWVASASVQRRWPGSVQITVVERVAVAQVRDGAGWARVDAGGRVLARTSGRLGGVPVIAGVRGGAVGTTVHGAHDALTLATALPPEVSPQIDGLALRRGELWLVLRSEAIQVRIGPPTQLAAKIDAMGALLASAERTPRILTIDVLVPSAPVLTRQHAVAPDPGLTKDQGGA